MYYFIVRKSLKSEVCVSGLEAGHASVSRSLTASEVVFSPCLLPLPPVLQLFSVFYFRTASLTCQPPSSAFFFRTITITLVPTDDSGSVPSFKVLSLLSLLPRRSGYLQIVGTQVLPLLKGGDITVPSIIQSLWGPWSSRVGISAQFWLWSPWSQPLAINLFSLTGGAKSKTERHEWWESLCCYWESIGSFVIESW